MPLTETISSAKNPSSMARTARSRPLNLAALLYTEFFRSIPTLVVISDGEVIGAYPGVVGAEQLVGALDQLAPTPEPETVLQEGAAR